MLLASVIFGIVHDVSEQYIVQDNKKFDKPLVSTQSRTHSYTFYVKVASTNRLWYVYDKFSNAEIRNALFQIGPLKACGKDGFTTRFY